MCDSTMLLIICDMCDILQCKCTSLCCVPEVIVHVAVSISVADCNFSTRAFNAIKLQLVMQYITACNVLY